MTLGPAVGREASNSSQQLLFTVWKARETETAEGELCNTHQPQTPASELKAPTQTWPLGCNPSWELFLEVGREKKAGHIAEDRTAFWSQCEERPAVRACAQGSGSVGAGGRGCGDLGLECEVFPGPAAAHLPSGPRKDAHTLCICRSVHSGKTFPSAAVDPHRCQSSRGERAAWLHGGREPAYSSGSHRPGQAPTRGLVPLAASVSPSTHEPTASHPAFLPAPPSHCHSVLRPHVLQTSADLMGAPCVSSVLTAPWALPHSDARGQPFLRPRRAPRGP